ncbi:CWF19-like protein 1 [Cylas formicarius]|uniref:CWF19-like protein 1 n=1 Tax=Cylas formicarius TaxID=197179 RepID=UPI00295856F6|nr:CWF19-like protein 1 [Cylas formicarius]
MTERAKILLCGDVEGNFDTLCKRVEIVNKKTGPFDLVLCVGNFFGINNQDFIPYKMGEKKVPLATYILGPNYDYHVKEYQNEQYELCENVYHLGKRGIYTDSKGVRIAYISGIASLTESGPWTYNFQDVRELCDLPLRGNTGFRGVDILVSSQWPKDIVQKDHFVSKFQHEYVSYLCMKLKPRYVVSGLEGVYYERPPFRCPSTLESGTALEIVTRFLGLARVGNPKKEKWLYALSLTPLDKMKLSELIQKTTDETPCPFDFSRLEAQVCSTNNIKRSMPKQYFYDVNTLLNDDIVILKGQKRQKIDFDQSKCWFCLASPSFEKHLVVTVGESCYLSMAKGGLVDEHLLICPIEHFQSSLSCSEDIQREMIHFKEALRKFYERKDQVPIFSERNYKTSHMQLQVIPIPRKATNELQDIFIEESEVQGFKLEELGPNSRFHQVMPPKIPFFSVELPNKLILYTKIQGSVNFPLNFKKMWRRSWFKE